MNAWGWPEVTLTAILAFQTLCFAFLDGKPKTGSYSFALSVCGTAITAFLLYMGGFWS